MVEFHPTHPSSTQAPLKLVLENKGGHTAAGMPHDKNERACASTWGKAAASLKILALLAIASVCKL